MLGIIRDKKKSGVVKFVFWAIIAAFVGTIFLVWGQGGKIDEGQADVAAEVNGSPITSPTPPAPMPARSRSTRRPAR